MSITDYIAGFLYIGFHIVCVIGMIIVIIKDCFKKD